LQSFNLLKTSFNQVNPDYSKTHGLESDSHQIYSLKNWKKKPDQSNYIFHYTSIENAKSILISNKIYKTRARIKKFGTGVFMTSVQPFEEYSVLLENIYLGNPKYSSRLECAFAINKYICNQINAHQFTDPMYPSRDLWICEDDIELHSTHNVFYLIIREDKS
jgi:hypothetical protein